MYSCLFCHFALPLRHKKQRGTKFLLDARVTTPFNSNKYSTPYVHGVLRKLILELKVPKGTDVVIEHQE